MDAKPQPVGNHLCDLGGESTRQIRARLPADRQPKIIALTANAMSHQVSEYLRCGMDAVVPKPIEAARLYEALQAAAAYTARPPGRSRAQDTGSDRLP